MIKNPEARVDKFTWKIENFSKLDSRTSLNFKKLFYSQNFFLCGHPWCLKSTPFYSICIHLYVMCCIYLTFFFLNVSRWICIYPMGENVDYFKIYLDVDSLPRGWSEFAYFTLALINQTNHKMTIRYGNDSY